MTPLLKNVFSLVAILAVLYAGYYLYVINKNSTLKNGDGIQSVEQAQIQSREFLELLTELESMKLSNEIFEDPRFTSLRVNIFPLNSVRVGNKANPFIEQR